MRISDWSSDVCSSDLFEVDLRITMMVGESVRHHGDTEAAQHGEEAFRIADASHGMHALAGERRQRPRAPTGNGHRVIGQQLHRRSEERRVGKEWVSPCRYRWSPNH